MRIVMQSGAQASQLHYSRWKTAIVGSVVDDRGGVALDFIRANADSVISLTYRPDPPAVSFNEEEFSPEDLYSLLEEHALESLVLEATTLGFVEILLICRTLKELDRKSVSMIYTEPKRYRRPRGELVLHKRDFELSEEVEGFSGVPGSVFMLRGDKPTKAVFLVGYEGQRLEQALEQTAVRPSECSIVFGVPAFQAGWEMDSFANNVRIIRQRDVSGEILFGGAQNPMAAFSAIERVYQACNRARGERLIIAPIGTKPHGIGAALFACEHVDVGVIYDHPRRSKGRSDDVATWHIYEVGF